MILKEMVTLSGEKTLFEIVFIVLSPFWKVVYSKRKEFAPIGSKFFHFRVGGKGSKFFPFRIDTYSIGFLETNSCLPCKINGGKSTSFIQFL